MFKKIFILSFFCFISTIEANVLTASLPNQEPVTFGYSHDSGWATGPFWINIHCMNQDEIAGFQFELGQNLELLNVQGVRSEDAGFQLHHNKKGLILGFSMSGDRIPKSINSDGEDSIILKIQVKAGGQVDYPIKSILAGSNGERLSFPKDTTEFALPITSGITPLDPEGNPIKSNMTKQIKISFFE